MKVCITVLFRVLGFVAICLTVRGSLVPRPAHIQCTENDKLTDWLFNISLFYAFFAKTELWMVLIYCVFALLYFRPLRLLKLWRKKKRQAFELHPFAPPFLRPLHVGEMLSLAASVGGYYLRQASFDALGDMFTYAVTIKAQHELIQTGPYTLLVHPSYTGIVMAIFGAIFYIGVHSPKFWGFAITCLIFVLGPRIYNEEEVLAENFGQTWNNFVSSRWRMVPYVL